ncbi:MAG: CoB--CoM heterodisulfide reductase iron-sulfur subunit A family protein [Humidesulfovibrio sp.]|nr:CoB--CoM heterodisulfide reductase iron-sulfur subunit A family protein [Humidesulfovibrio sp.]
MRIGVMVCHCGNNIAATVDVEAVAAAAREFPDVVYATDHMYACSDPGQKTLEQTIRDLKLDGVVVASCSPRMHELTFRRAVERAGLNRYMFEMANIREHVAWISLDRKRNTQKATDLVRMAVEKLRVDRPLTAKSFDVQKRVLIVGGGVAGIQAALDCADGGLDVVLVERKSSIGGIMSKLDKTFPTVDCSVCVLGPKMVDAGQNPRITLHMLSEVEEVSGYVGNFEVKVRKHTTYVDWTKCTGCGACEEKCPSRKVPDAFNENVSLTTAIGIPFPQATPKRATINAEHCLRLTKGKCGVCEKICPTGAIDYDLKDEVVTEKVGAIIAATGLNLFDHRKCGEYGAGRYPDVVTSLAYERMLSASGPTAGHIKRPSDGAEPKTVVFIACVGSRDRSLGRPYCSNFCCMYTAKQAILTRDHIPDSKAYVFYMDIRANGKGYEEFVRRAQEEYGVEYVRGRVAQVYPKDGKLIVRGTDTLLGQQVEVPADLVVLAVGVEAAKGAPELAEKLRISYDAYGFFMESHPKLRPVETNTVGVFLAGACQGPKDIPASVAQASAAAGKVLALLSKDKLESDPQIAQVATNRCIGCGKCERTCPFGAIRMRELRDGSKRAEVVETVCQGCGICSVTCPVRAIQLQHFTDSQLLAEVNALCRIWDETTES